jgi:hypothetical protein
VVKIVGFGPGYNDELEIESAHEIAEVSARDFLDAWRELYRQVVLPVTRLHLAAAFPARPATEPTDPGVPPAELDDPDRAPQAPPEPV